VQFDCIFAHDGIAVLLDGQHASVVDQFNGVLFVVALGETGEDALDGLDVRHGDENRVDLTDGVNPSVAEDLKVARGASKQVGHTRLIFPSSASVREVDAVVLGVVALRIGSDQQVIKQTQKLLGFDSQSFARHNALSRR
jgi:hypothetical protein